MSPQVPVGRQADGLGKRAEVAVLGLRLLQDLHACPFGFRPRARALLARLPQRGPDALSGCRGMEEVADLCGAAKRTCRVEGAQQAESQHTAAFPRTLGAAQSPLSSSSTGVFRRGMNAVTAASVPYFTPGPVGATVGTFPCD